MIFYGTGVKVVWLVRVSERCGRQTNHDEFSRQIVNLAPHKILDNFYISRIYLVHV